MTGFSFAACSALSFALAVSASPAFAQSAAPAPGEPAADNAAPPPIPPPPPGPETPPPPTTQPPAGGPMLTIPRGKIDLSTPPPAPSIARSYHTHDGFYLRGSFGFGSLNATFDDNHPSGEDLKGSGAALAGEILIGGSPAPGVAIGGGLLFEGTASVDFERGPLRGGDRSLFVGIVGPFIDGFPIPNKGWHLGAMLGLARVSIEDASADSLRHTNGFGGAFWLGHDFWVGDEWSIGPMLRFSGALTRASDPTAHAASFGASLLFTGLYH